MCAAADYNKIREEKLQRSVTLEIILYCILRSVHTSTAETPETVMKVFDFSRIYVFVFFLFFYYVLVGTGYYRVHRQRIYPLQNTSTVTAIYNLMLILFFYITAALSDNTVETNYVIDT